MSTPLNKTAPQNAEEREAELDAQIRKSLEDYAEEASTLNLEDELDRPTYGATVYLAHTKLETRFGEFTSFIFQDIIHKGYIIALTYGDVASVETLYTRVHSSCVTSETLRGCDCDCVQQLEGAIQKIAQEGSGVLFYLLQEGRGVGYVAKARDRMIVQASMDTISTFEAYAMLGLNKDYRQYRNVRDIAKILKIDASWIVLTNNPDKIEAMKKNGFRVERSESLEFEPEPYNLAYLRSKAHAGHILKRPLSSALQGVKTPEKVIPFKPRSLGQARRFLYMASYFLPVRPVNNEIMISKEEEVELFGERSMDAYMHGESPLIESRKELRGGRILVKIDRYALTNFQKSYPEDPVCSLLTKPYWFRAHVYFDIVSGLDYVVLSFGKATADDVPVVRIQSESLFNRFPVTHDENKAKYNRALQEIVSYGCGVVVLAYEDGRGAGFGAFAVDRMMLDQGESESTAESYEKIGIEFDSRDYEGLMTVLKQHLPSNRIQMIMNSPNSLVLKGEYTKVLSSSNMDVEKWIFLDDSTMV